MKKEFTEISVDNIQLFSSKQAWHYRLIPFSQNENNISFYCAKNIDDTKNLKTELNLIFEKEIIFESIDEDVLKQLLSKYYHISDNNQSRFSNFHFDDDFLQRIIQEAKEVKASDIHIEGFEEYSLIRFRIDGSLIEKYRLEKDLHPALINKIKVAAKLDIAEKRLPQDGRIIQKGNENVDDVDIRVSIIPAFFGEKIVMRLLGRNSADINLNILGFNNQQIELYSRAMRKQKGLILISGPTGSGKTTTLYATLKTLNKVNVNILTIEDPIEYLLEGINQVQVKESIGLKFSEALRSFLRQDPDIIMVGEIRDVETAQMAIRASLTGHLVLSTVHTNSAWGTISRMIDMGIPAYLLADTLNISVAQRLLKKLCPLCKKEISNQEKQVLESNYPQIRKYKVFQAVGCNHCYHTGYLGRKAIYEVIPIDEDFKRIIKSNNSETDISELIKKKHISLLQDLALNALINGETSIEEASPYLINYNNINEK
jgi:type II secretory ATPase GspE/PulE/Tfp pilus assembly ATPase PilB-like protein